jgi:nitrogen regulatory protein P-II 2
MKFVIAIIQPHRLDAVREALQAIQISGMTVTEVRGYGRQGGHKEIYRGAEYAIAFVPKLKLEIAVADNRVEEVVGTISNGARTGHVGDGKIFILDLESVVRVRTGEADEAAL